MQKRKEAYEPTFRSCVAIGVMLCILGVVPLLIAAGFGARDLVCVSLTDILLIMIACAVFLFVRSGVVYGSFSKLLQEDDYTIENKEFNQKVSFFPGIYWCIVVAIYLGISFTQNNWEQSWIVWPVAGVLFAAIMGILKATVKK